MAVIAGTAFVAAGEAAAQDRILRVDHSIAQTIDAHTAPAEGGLLVQINLYDSLYRYTDNPPKMVPWLATSHTVSEDGLTWEYTIRDNVKFHDGTPLTAEDVVYSFRRALALPRSPAAVFRTIMKPENVTAPAPNKVRFQISKPFAPFHSAIPLIAIVNSKLVKQHEHSGDWGEKWLSANTAGSGAYKMVPESFRPQEKLELEYNPDYFQKWSDKPIKRVHIRYIHELSTQMLGLTRGDVDISNPRLPGEQLDRLKSNPNLAISQEPAMRLFLFTMNTRKPPLDNVHVRRAISYAFNYDAFIAQILNNVSKRNGVPLPLGMWGRPSDVTGYTYDPTKAKAEIEKARQQGVDLKAEIEMMTIAGTEETAQAGLLLQSELRKLGLNLKINRSSFYSITGLTGQPQSTPAIWTHWVSTYYVDPDNWIGGMYHSDFHGTWKGSSWYKNPKVDELLAQARTTIDQSKREKLYQDAVRLVVDDAPGVWIYDTVQIRAVKKDVAGYTFTPIGSGTEFWRMHWR
jgi:peptide/nickel transport system substrate-binding protein